MRGFQCLLTTLWIVIIVTSPVMGRMVDRDIDQLVNFILDDNRDQHGQFGLPINDTVRMAVDGLQDRLKCVQQGLTHFQCSQCLKVEDVLRILGPDSKSKVTNHLDLEHLSVVLLQHVLTFRTTCAKENQASQCTSYIACRTQLQKKFPIGSDTEPKVLDDIEAVLREIKVFYDPIPGEKCFSAETVLKELRKLNDGKHSHLEQMTTLLIAHLLNGECIDVGEAVTDFLEDLFVHYGDRCNRVITQTGFEKLVNDLKTQDRNDHKDHNIADDSCSEEFREDLKRKTSPESFITMAEVSGIPRKLLEQNIYITKEVSKRSAKSAGQSLLDQHKHRSLASECLTADGILKTFAKIPSQTITPLEFLQLCPALVQQVVSGVCNGGSNTSVTMKYSRPSNLEIYGYGTLAVFVISLTSLCGIFLIPIMTKKYYTYVMIGFIGLSFGTMAGDALLHLIPQALGLHQHDEAEGEEEDHDVVSIETIPYYIWQQLGIFLAIYVLFLFETVMHTISGKKSGSHGHSHIPEKLPETLTMKNLNSNNTISDMETNEKNEPVIKSTEVFWGLTTISLVIIIGDTFHNFGDGLAIGASFAPGIRGGLSTSLAVFCHELPHEIGDFAVLLSTGLSFGKALFMNFLSALFSFVGLYIGIQLGEDLNTRNWILTATAGIFIYVSLTEMLPELKSSKYENKWTVFVLKNVGILCGICLMMIIAIYEGHFHL